MDNCPLNEGINLGGKESNIASEQSEATKTATDAGERRELAAKPLTHTELEFGRLLLQFALQRAAQSDVRREVKQAADPDPLSLASFSESL